MVEDLRVDPAAAAPRTRPLSSAPAGLDRSGSVGPEGFGTPVQQIGCISGRNSSGVPGGGTGGGMWSKKPSFSS